VDYYSDMQADILLGKNDVSYIDINSLHMTSNRKYQETHPWLTFHIDMERASPGLWLALGECQSKCEHIAGVPLQPDSAERLYRLYLAKGALATTAIEGNTLSEEEVLQHLEGKLELPRSREYLKQEIDNILEACNRTLAEVKARIRLPLTAQRIMELNRIVLDKLPLDEGVRPGEIRRHDVTVARYRGAPAEDCFHLLERLCNWLSGRDFTPAHTGVVLATAILKSVIAHLYLAWIHPFADGNGRTARLVEFQILISSGVPAPAAHLLSNHYNQTRAEYYRQLDHASKSGGDVLPFISYAIQGLVDGLRSQLQEVRRLQLDIAWQNYVHDSFRHKTGATYDRRKHLVLDLSTQAAPVPLAALAQLSPRLAVAYANKTKRTLARDVNELMKMGLLRKEKGAFRARKERILAFLPPRAEPSNSGSE
jgi:Fic family protein